METLAYSDIEPLVADQTVRGNAVDVTFRCAATGVEATATGPLKRLDSFSDQASRTVKKNLWSGLRRSATRAVADTLGKGTAGKIARELTSTGLKQAEKNTAFSRNEVEAAVVAAFGSVRQMFRLDEARGVWIGDPAALSATVERPPRG
ncbi:MAG: hypothetical protein AAF957_11140 [Planctomycetota bacterium]